MATAPTETQTVRAQAKWVRTSARKARVVAEHIRGRSVPEARAVLAFTQRAAAREIEKRARLRRRERRGEPRPPAATTLVVATAVVDEGPTLKRWRARARGRVARIKKRTCHITVHARAGRQIVQQAPSRSALRSRRRRRRPRPSRDGGDARGRSAKRRPPRSRTANAEDAERRRPRAREAEGARRAKASGPESSSRRAPRRRDPRLEVELVHDQQGLQGRPARGHQDPRAHQQEARPRRPVGHPDPQGQAADHDRHLHGAPGDRDRQVRRRGRRAAPRRARA